MAEPYVGEIIIFGGTYAPRGWAFCDGQLLSISEYDVLFAIIGTTYGGDGQNTFALPDLRGRIPIGTGQGPGLSNQVIGERAGVESVTLTTNQMPIHNHALLATTTPATSESPNNALFAQSSDAIYTADQTIGPSVANGSIGTSTGGNIPVDIMNPYLAVNYIISLYGVFPSRN
ncbi:MAG: phage tail protein [Methylobacter sp.]|nr:MAG: phage tail protein [Methylobacter sp.]